MEENKTLKNQTRKERIETVNKIIKHIASRGRYFFKNKQTGFISYIFEKNNQIYFVDYYTLEEIPLKSRFGKKWIKFSSGGTLKGLVLDFNDFIISGTNSNGNNGYGGLYCTHWGYSEEEMKKINDYATKLGYL